MRMVRAVLVLASLALTAWFAVGVRQALDTNRATALITRGAHLQQASALLASAKLLNPDRTVDILHAELDLDEHREAAARSLLERVVAAEPDDAVAWEWLAKASVGDLREFYRAAFRLEQLVPPVRVRQ
jgi:predicted Zn-dependent protease